MRWVALGIWTCAMFGLMAASGCGGGNTPKNNAAHSHDDHSGHDHHDHDHGAKGPVFGGHILELGKEEYHVEWQHDDESGNVKIAILDASMKKEVPIAAAEVIIETKVGETQNTYKLPATNPSAGENPMASRFELEDKPLVAALKAAGKGVTAKLNVKIGDKDFSAAITHEEHKH